MGAYLDRLNEQFDTITAGIDEILNRAADENREVSSDEQQLVEREQVKAVELKKSIDHYAGIEETRSQVSQVRAKIPASAGAPRVERSGPPERVGVEDPAKQLQALFPTAGHYVVTVGRALRGDKDAGQVIERALEIQRATDTAHQTTLDNPGLLPRPILQPVIDLINGERPFIQSILQQPLPTESFDRPIITQHVAVGKQEREKTRTESRQLKVGKLPVHADTYAGHLNISRQDIRWSTPGIMQLVVNSFGDQYALETDEDAVAQFLASLEGTTPIGVDAWDGAKIRKLLFKAAAKPLSKGKPLGFPNTFWMSIDVWAGLGSLLTPLGVPYFPGLEPGTIGGTVAGFRAVVDPFFPPGTAKLGRGSLVEWYEDLEGLIQVAEPDVLGQLVGYAGYGAFLNTVPDVVTSLELPPVDDDVVEEALASVSPADGEGAGDDDSAAKAKPSK